jgi:hypothetical protein
MRDVLARFVTYITSPLIGNRLPNDRKEPGDDTRRDEHAAQDPVLTEVAPKMSMNPTISRPTDRPMEVSCLVHLRMIKPTFGKRRV